MRVERTSEIGYEPEMDPSAIARLQAHYSRNKAPIYMKAISSKLLPILLLIVFSMSAQAVQPKLAGQRVLVTGAGRGIGKAIALICSEEGAKVAITSRTKSELEETATQAKNEMDIYECDVKNEQQVESMVQSIAQKWGCIDVLINNAGGAQAFKGPAHTLKTDDLKNLLHLNIVAVHTVTSAVIRHTMLENGGRIVNVSSKAGKIGIPNMSFYVASKFALEGYSATLAEELKDKNVLVNTISPGMVDTKSFPKPPGKVGVRTPESVRDGLLTVLESGLTGQYLHVDELDEARGKGLDDSVALKPINEPKFLQQVQAIHADSGTVESGSMHR